MEVGEIGSCNSILLSGNVHPYSEGRAAVEGEIPINHRQDSALLGTPQVTMYHTTLRGEEKGH